MKEQHKTIAVLGAIVALSGVLAGNMALGFFDNDSSSANSLATSGLMTGHVTMTVYDADGNIKAYQQSDNIIVNQGENCAVKTLFGNVTGATGVICGDDVTDGPGHFNVIAIGNQTVGTDTAADGNLKLVNEHNQTNSGFTRVRDTTPAYTAASGSTAAKVVLSNAFTLAADGSAGSSRTVSESGLFNATIGASMQATHNADAMFARQTFSPITVNAGETLTVEWTVNVGGAGTLGSEPTSSQ
ncbi:MAG: hypothetical protein DWQ18_00075 [Crenarchaeota archaeon]|nr:MAG: hypothetical protein DWQ17_05140 [Thermoproteota archaeon]RDJ34389.1 MAG: hypothetical protein DWQ18_00075 [Thermoproteota archaeon]RDJ34727.1 MAG: hypothetical protein DWQ19_13190 [Thermoproteota archaeon]RDJ38672.1 MAG: hypothetical protein DWQ13_04745 [Thermoproteota archaeon]